jgi:hypothetical protein
VSDADYRARSQENAPKTPEQVEAAAQDLAGRGYSDDVIASVLRINIDLIRQMLGERPA